MLQAMSKKPAHKWQFAEMFSYSSVHCLSVSLHGFIGVETCLTLRTLLFLHLLSISLGTLLHLPLFGVEGNTAQALHPCYSAMILLPFSNVGFTKHRAQIGQVFYFLCGRAHYVEHYVKEGRGLKYKLQN